MANYDNNGKCVLDEAQKKHYYFKCSLCKMIKFLDFKEAANECAIVCLKRRQFVVKFQKQIKEEKLSLERKNNKSIRKIFEQ